MIIGYTSESFMILFHPSTKGYNALNDKIMLFVEDIIRFFFFCKKNARKTSHYDHRILHSWPFHMELVKSQTGCFINFIG